MLRLKDLKEQGFELNKADAMELHSIISHHAQRGTDAHLTVFEGDKDDHSDSTDLNDDDGGGTTAKKKGGRQPKAKEPELVDHIVTQEDLDNNPDLVEQNINVGDTIKIPVKE